MKPCVDHFKKEAGGSSAKSGCSFDPQELAASFGDRKIEAIKYVRERTGLGLKEAKDLVDAAYEKSRFAAPVPKELHEGMSHAGTRDAYTGPEIEDKPRPWKFFLLGAAVLLLAALVYFFFFNG